MQPPWVLTWCGGKKNKVAAGNCVIVIVITQKLEDASPPVSWAPGHIPTLLLERVLCKWPSVKVSVEPWSGDLPKVIWGVRKLAGENAGNGTQISEVKVLNSNH